MLDCVSYNDRFLKLQDLKDLHSVLRVATQMAAEEDPEAIGNHSLKLYNFL